jgi:hypothetical protein
MERRELCSEAVEPNSGLLAVHRVQIPAAGPNSANTCTRPLALTASVGVQLESILDAEQPCG